MEARIATAMAKIEVQQDLLSEAVLGSQAARPRQLPTATSYQVASSKTPVACSIRLPEGLDRVAEDRLARTQTSSKARKLHAKDKYPLPPVPARNMTLILERKRTSAAPPSIEPHRGRSVSLAPPSRTPKDLSSTSVSLSEAGVGPEEAVPGRPSAAPLLAEPVSPLSRTEARGTATASVPRARSGSLPPAAPTTPLASIGSGGNVTLGSSMPRDAFHLLYLSQKFQSTEEGEGASGDLTAPRLPLELFEDADMCLFQPAEWLERKKRGERGVRAFAQRFSAGGEYEWTPCWVTDYDEAEGLYSVLFEDTDEVARKVRRFNVRFAEESVESFEARLERARRLRDEAERDIRTRLFLERLEKSSIPPMPSQDAVRIMELGAPTVPRAFVPFVEGFLTDAQEEFAISVQRAIIDHERRDPNVVQTSVPLGLAAPPEEKPPPSLAVVAVDGMSPSTFADIQDKLFARLIIAHPAVITALMRLREMLDSNSPKLFVSDFSEEGRMLELERFVAVQDAQMTKSVKDFREAWLPFSESIIVESLDTIFDFYTSSQEDFAATEMGRFEQLVCLMMSNELRTLVMTYIGACKDFFSRFALAARLVNVLKDPQSMVRHQCLLEHVFAVRVSVEMGDGGAAIRVLPSVADFHAAADRIIDRMLEDTRRSMPRLNARLWPLLSFPPDFVRSLEADDPSVVSTRSFIHGVLDTNFSLVEPVLALLARHLGLFGVDLDSKLSSFKGVTASSRADLEGLYNEIQGVRDALDDVNLSVPSQVPCNMFMLDCSEAKRQLRERGEILLGSMLELLRTIALAESQRICKEFQTIFERLSREPQNPEEMMELREFLDSKQELLEGLQAAIAHVGAVVTHLTGFNHVMSAEDLGSYFDAVSWPRKVQEMAESVDEKMTEHRRKFLTELRDDQERLEVDMSSALVEVTQASEAADIEQAEDQAQLVGRVRKTLDGIQERVVLYQSREHMFECPVTEYPKFQDAARGFAPFEQLWMDASAFAKEVAFWTDGSFLELDPEQVESRMNLWLQNSRKLARPLASHAAAARVHRELKERLDGFQKHLPLIKWLRQPGMKQYHWDKINQAVGKRVQPDETTTLANLTSMGLESHYGVIRDVSETAAREYALERAIDKMQAEWKSISFEFVLCESAYVQVLSGVDKVMSVLDDHIVKTQTIRGHPNVKPIEDRVKRFEDKLNHAQDVLLSWLQCQRMWLYLEPVFASEDIRTQLPNETKRFLLVDRGFRRTMENAVRKPNVMNACGEESLLKEFTEANAQLDAIHQGLSEYLEGKRLAFPRLFFLSNDELLSIISDSRDPLRVQPHLRKCFENIDHLEFQPNLDITALLSKEGERVPFDVKVNPRALGNSPEVWLKEVERVMRTSLKDVLLRALEEYQSAPRKEWVLRWPGQIVLAVTQLVWTRQVTEALSESGFKGLRKYEEELTHQLDELVEMVRGDLSPLDRVTLGALVVLQVHARDVVTAMIAEHVARVTDFEFQSQLRYYLEDETLRVRMVTHAMDYGFEYLGNTSRLVITPLTDRCYRTLFGALQMTMGGAPEGPAGTGKTETVKDLAKAVAKQCVVFNCSEGLDFQSMGKFFKGLVSSGAWSCFDEFNRIDVEVLSVVAQQVLSIQQALATKLENFTFEGTFLTVNPTCAVFTTMNPGYAGRAELPDNLKSLFRPVAMMIPDYALIGEIMLYSSGFHEGRPLARKLVATFRLCSEQLSSQDHYDYGMRAVKTVLVAAAELKRSLPTVKEEELMLRAILDVSVPKFLERDLQLFHGIVSDLFPGVTQVTRDHDRLHACLQEAATEQGLEMTPNFMKKCVQIYETMSVVTGVMIVGLPFSGKTCCYRTLANGLTRLSKDTSAAHKEKPVHYTVLNPKSISVGQIFGHFDIHSHEWKDGLLSRQFREYASTWQDDRRWIVFDGPVDALWIESLNTVLDDNKRLCLVSGEVIPLAPGMTMLFEVRDLSAASPATVSRCGIVFIEPNSLGWKPILDSFWRSLKECLPDHPSEESVPGSTPFRSTAEEGEGSGAADRRQQELAAHQQDMSRVVDVLSSMVSWILEPAMAVALDDGCQKEVAVTAPWIARNFVSMLDCLLRGKAKKAAPEQFNGESESAPPVRTIASLSNVQLGGTFVMAAIWSIGGPLTSHGKSAFTAKMRDILDSRAPSTASMSLGFERFPLPIPKGGSVFDYMFDVSSTAWVPWDSTVPRFAIPENAQFHEIIVPTTDSIRLGFWLETLLLNGKNVLLSGGTGTGKTVVVRQTLMSHQDDFKPILLQFSGQSTAAQTQMIIDSKLDRRRQGVYGPPLGSRCVIFVDDVHMPEKDRFGSQPAIELLRQFLDHGGWYDAKSLLFRHIQDTSMVCAHGRAGAGGTMIGDRFTRHFCVFAVPEADAEDLHRIFRTILDALLSDLSSDVTSMIEGVVVATVEAYTRMSVEFLPVPSKPHYVFNLRDLSDIFQGLCTASPRTIRDGAQFARLWYHESSRRLCDRLVDQTDLDYARNMLIEVACKNLKKIGPEQLVPQGSCPSVLFCDFSDITAEPSERLYSEVVDMGELKMTLEQALDEHNATVRGRQLSLILFGSAVEHMVRIARILRRPFGNALLVGVGGSGRESLTRLVAHVMHMDIFEIEPVLGYSRNEWRADLKRLLRKAGVSLEKVVFIFRETHILHPSFLEDVNNILNTGEVPHLFQDDEINAIVEAVRPAAHAAGKSESRAGLYAYFVERCRECMRVVICLSPAADQFRGHLRNYPSLVNCCTIDWFLPWPEDALLAVSMQKLDVPEVRELDRAKLARACVRFHRTVERTAMSFTHELRRHCYVTPASFLEFLATFTELAEKKGAETASAKSRYLRGVARLIETGQMVKQLQEEAETLEKVLLVTQHEVDGLVEDIQQQKQAADEAKIVVEEESHVVQLRAEEEKKLFDECESDLAKALPALEASISSLKSLDRQLIAEVRSMQKPPDAVRIVMEAVLIMFEIEPARKETKVPGKFTDDYWTPAQRLLADVHFLERVISFDRDSVKEEVVVKVRPYLKRADFRPDKVRKASVAAEHLCRWVRAMETYFRVNKVVAPKKAALQEARSRCDAVNQDLQAKVKRLAMLETHIESLVQQRHDAEEKRHKLKDQLESTRGRAERARVLTDALSSERGRWASKVEELKGREGRLTGDLVACAGVVAYFGPFSAPYRDSAYAEFLKALTELQITFTEGVGLASVLGDPIQIRLSHHEGLPPDRFSETNGLIVWNSRRFPLIIDPQGQANKWIRNFEGKNNLMVLRQTDESFVRNVENAVSSGTPVLIENLGEEINSILDPVLQKRVFHRGGFLVVQIGDHEVEFSSNFRLYMTTKMSNPDYKPEVAAKVCLVNFSVTPKGLSDQLLSALVAKEQPSLEDERSRLIVENQGLKKELRTIEDRILEILSSGSGDILAEEQLYTTLKASKRSATEIEDRVRDSERMEAETEQARDQYSGAASAAAMLFFAVVDLHFVEPMYEFSLMWFIELFLRSIQDSVPSMVISDRTAKILDHFRYALYRNVCRSLFEKDKLLFSFLLCAKTLEGKGEIDPDEYRIFLLSGGTVTSTEQDASAVSAPSWLSAATWRRLQNLWRTCRMGEAFKSHFLANLDQWKQFVEGDSVEKMPGNFQDTLSPMQQLIVLRCLRLDKVVSGIRQFVSKMLGPRFVEPPMFDLQQAYADSSSTIPLLFVLSPGMDPTSQLLKFAEKMGFGRRIRTVSLGQGQGPVADALIRESTKRGQWVVLQNCHLAVKWMPDLEVLLDALDFRKLNPDFRLWMTSLPTPRFPVAILQSSIKITNEPPRGLATNMLRTFLSPPVADPEFLNSCEKGKEFRKLVFGLCYFHAVASERRAFGPLGWNTPYAFTEADFIISVRQMQLLLNESPFVPYKALMYVIGEANYGGRVTDDWDRRTLRALLGDVLNSGILDDDFRFSGMKQYFAPKDTVHENYVSYIRKLPQEEGPELLGFHPNAAIARSQDEAEQLFASILETQARSSAVGGKAEEAVVAETASAILSRFPEDFDIASVLVRYPITFENSMNTVLVQDLLRYNRLLGVIRGSLRDLQRALQGQIVLSTDLDAMMMSMFHGRVPALWRAASFPSLKPLASYVDDLLARLRFFQEWVRDGPPPIFWLSAFFFTQSFLTGQLQLYGRKHEIAIDKLSFDVEILDENPTEPPPDGCYISGLLLEGARWDVDKGVLEDSQFRELFCPLPPAWLVPVQTARAAATPHYSCPVYLTRARRGELSTTGHSTNFVLTVPLPSDRDEKYWIKRGVAILLSTSE